MRERVRELREQGMSLNGIARALGVSKSTVVYHLRRAGETPDDRFNRRYDWAQIQAYYDEGHSVTECQRRFGFSKQTWHAARKRGAVVSRPTAMPLDQLLAGVRKRTHLKARLFALGVKENRCEMCGIEDWLRRPLGMTLHHVNGDGNDNRLENLQMLCPNCHSQTDNFAGRNRRRLGTVESSDADGPPPDAVAPQTRDGGPGEGVVHATAA